MNTRRTRLAAFGRAKRAWLVVTPASVQDWDGGREAMLLAKRAAPGLRRVFADSAYVAYVHAHRPGAD